MLVERVCAECFVDGGDDKNIPLLKDVFEAFPKTPINIDIKVNDDTLISKVSVTSPQWSLHQHHRERRNVYDWSIDRNRC